MDRNLDARDHVSRVLNVHLVYQYKHLILLMTMLLLDTNPQQHRLDRLDRLDLCIFSFVPGVGGRVNRLVGRLKNPLVSPVRPSFLSSFFSFTTIEMNSIVQLLKTWTYPEQVGQEFDHIKDHLDSYISSTTSTTSTTTTTTTTSATPHRPKPSRHISHLTQMAAKALNRPVHGLAVRKRPPGQGQGPGPGGEREKVGWDELEVYKSKADWRAVGLEKGMEDVEAIKMVEQAGWEGVAALDRRWDKSWECDRMSK